MARFTNRRTAGNRSRRAGFTVIELLIVLMCIGVVVLMAVPPLFATIRGTRLEAVRTQLVSDLRLARMEAIRRNVSIAVVRTSSTTYRIDSIGMRTLAEGARFSTGPTTLRFEPFGPVKTGATSYTLQLNGKTSTVVVTTAGNAIAK